MENSLNIKLYDQQLHKRVIIILGIFILLDTVKVTVFNYMIMSTKTLDAFLYKFVLTLLINLVFFPLFFKIKSRIPFIIFYFAQIVYIFSYLSYFSYFKNYLHLFQVAALFTEGMGPVKHFSIPVEPGMAVVFIDIPLFISLMIRYSSIKILYERFKPFMKYIVIFSVAALLSIEGWNYSYNYSIVQLNKDFFVSEPKIIDRYGTLINNISDISVNYGGENLIKHFHYGKAVQAFSEVSQNPDIVAIQVESMDANIVNKKYNDQYVMPYLHSLSTKSIYYPYTFSYHKSGGTSDCEFSIINSIEPLSNFPSIKLSKYNYPNSFIKDLDKDNYNTMAFHGNVGNYYNRDVAFKKMGFKDFFDIKKMGFKDEGWGAPDGDVFNSALENMKNQSTPFFSYIITMSSHMPFTSVDGYYKNNRYDSIQQEDSKNYFKSFSYVDTAIEDFVGKVQSSYPDAYILIWGDHTPDINNSVYSQASFISGKDYFEFVPLIILTPDKKVYRENNSVASFLDIAPTILYASGVKPSIKSDGINLIDPPEERPDIPFKEGLYNREDLYNKIKDIK